MSSALTCTSHPPLSPLPLTFPPHIDRCPPVITGVPVYLPPLSPCSSFCPSAFFSPLPLFSLIFISFFFPFYYSYSISRFPPFSYTPFLPTFFPLCFPPPSKLYFSSLFSYSPFYSFTFSYHLHSLSP